MSCAEPCLCFAQDFFELGAGHSRFNRDGLIGFVKVNHLVKVPPHIKADAALKRFYAAGNGRAAAVYIEGNVLLLAVFDNLHDFFMT